MYTKSGLCRSAGSGPTIFNHHANAMLDGWISLIAGGPSAKFRLRSFDIGDGIDAEFELIRVSGFSGTVQ
jgi:hypothetical protein